MNYQLYTEDYFQYFMHENPIKLYQYTDLCFLSPNLFNFINPLLIMPEFLAKRHPIFFMQDLYGQQKFQKTQFMHQRNILNQNSSQVVQDIESFQLLDLNKTGILRYMFYWLFGYQFLFFNLIVFIILKFLLYDSQIVWKSIELLFSTNNCPCFNENIDSSMVQLEKPEILFQKLELHNELQNIYKNISNDNTYSINEQIKEMEKQAFTLQQMIQEMLQKFLKCIQNIENLRKQFQQDLIKGFNFEPLKQLLIGLAKSEDTTNPDAINQLKQKLHQLFQQLQKDNGQEANNIILTKIYQTSNNVDSEIQKLQTLDQLKATLEKFHNDQYKIATSNYPHITKQIQSNLFTSYQQYKIINLIKERQKCEIQDINHIYLGSRDGLNAQSFWAKVDGKKNLLMIFKSQSNYIFGAYSPCQWSQQIYAYVQDDTNSSFLFSQTHDEIYPIVGNSYALYCHSTYGPTFGAGFDINITADFQGGGSALGHSYKQGTKYQDQYSTQLFGQETPNLIECEIFEIITK